MEIHLKYVNQVLFNHFMILVPEPLFTLKSHRSIVNSVLFHPHLPLIYTAGVEKLVRIFSPFPFSNPHILSSTQERDRGSRVQTHEAENLSEDASILNFFDMLTEADESMDIFSDSETD